MINAAIAAAMIAIKRGADHYQAVANEPARWLAVTLAATPLRQVDVVTARLKQLHSCFDAKFDSRNIEVLFQNWSMSTDLITDLSPQRTLSHLENTARLD